MAALSSPPADLLVVDDMVLNLQLLGELLRDRGYMVRTAASGEAALTEVRRRAPDLILLDVDMPNMTGFEVCAEMKRDPGILNVPVIFVSAHHDTAEKMRAFAAGAVDYVTKPFEFAEVEARVRTHLELRRQRRELEENYRQLRRLEELRDNLTHMIVHDLRAPLSVLSLAIDGALISKRSQLADRDRENLQGAYRHAQLLSEMIQQLLDVHRLESGQMPLSRARVDAALVAQTAVDLLAPAAGTRHIDTKLAPGFAFIDADETVLRRVVSNLLHNALKFTPPGGHIRVAAQRAADRVKITVADNGPGIPKEYHQRIFEKFGQVGTDARKLGTGLGLTFCRLAIEAHGGVIGVQSTVGKGATFWCTLPAVGPARAEGGGEGE